MTSIFDSEKSTDSDSDDDSDYTPPVELFSEEGKTLTLNYKEKMEEGGKTRNSQHLLKTNLYLDNKLKELKKAEVNLVEAKNQADRVYKSFLEEAAAEMKLLENEHFTSATESSEINSGSSVDTGCYKQSCSSNINIPEEVNETTKNTSFINPSAKDFKIDISTKPVSNLEKISANTLSQLSATKRRDLKSVMGNVLKKSKKETILSTSMQDWKKFKEEEDIADELKTYNQGKKGYLERQRFLERSDLQRFQIEREMRLSKRQTQGKNDV